ncbi:uncharacterized protein FSUBG_7611 [Fusarium subglutinans]|uniref:Uncharacterized protein n=1 Tax=Gibberella subglutinans TaxID=42677 RepID=A0A8H5UZ41_GIBSU|nr:uncharacterized protein FSUBG_7611 [Fusarium subglutinans]KAF5602735.1 hypothetical protein FSUBG_7611 [Fusarium subglutinans]
MSSTMTTTFKDLSDQAMTLIALMSEKIKVVRAASRTASEEEVSELVDHLETLTDYMTGMDEQVGGPDQQRMLMAVAKPATEVSSIHGVVRDNPLVHRIHQTDLYPGKAEMRFPLLRLKPTISLVSNTTGILKLIANMATNAPGVMPLVSISYSKVQKVHQAQSRILNCYLDLTNVVLETSRPLAHRYPSQNEIDELLGDLRSVMYFLFDMEHRFYSGHENERNLLQPLGEVTTVLEKQLYCIQLAINKLDPYRGSKDIFGMYCGVLVDENLARTEQEGGTGRIEDQMKEMGI